MIFSLDPKSKDATDNKSSSSIIFLAKTARDLPKKSNDSRFISFRRGTTADQDLRGKLLLLIVSDQPITDIGYTEDNFYKLFPPYDTDRDAMRNILKGYFNDIVSKFKSSTGDGEYEYCQVIAENVVSFKLTAYTLEGTGDNRVLKKISDDSADIKTPPYMLEIQLTMLDRDNYSKWLNIDGDEAREKFLVRHQRTFTRSVFIGNRWATVTD